MTNDFLKFRCSCAALVCSQISFAFQINGVQRYPTGRPEFIGRSRGERFECLGGAAALESNDSTDHRQVFKLHDRVFGEPLGQICGQPGGLRGVTRQAQRDGRSSLNISAI